MRFCILTQYYPPEIGAPQARLSELAVFLQKQGHEVTIFTAMPNYPTGKLFDGYGGFYRREYIDGVNIIRSYIFPSKSIKLISRLWNYFSFVLSSLVIGIFVLPKCDVFMTESPPLFLGISGFILSRVKGAKWIFNVSDLWPESAVNLGIIGNGIPLKLSKRLEAFFYKKSWLVTGQSREIVQNIRGRFPQVESYRLSNGVDVEKFDPRQQSDILQQWSVGKKMTVVYAGLHGIAQGLDQIIKAAVKLDKTVPELQIILIGDGPEKTQLADLAKQLNISNITFVNSQKKEKMPEIWASTDIALISLKQYIPGAVPSKLYEAMASGVPVLIIAEGEPAGIVNNSKCGIAVQPNDIYGITGAIQTLVENRELRKDMGKSGLLEVKNNFNRQDILNRFHKYVEDKIVYN
jgi:glycosyltransferase involved in cell wall biosynthesis|tara:strand:+ start:1460 stop:2677 length:1218 start_codon:yes stop_codon:yes gene_type:complete